MHERLVDRFGGVGGVRDVGLLESALYRPRSGYYNDVAEMATALFESLLMNHPFVDGNKRLAFFATDVFLRLNGWRLDVAPRRPTPLSSAAWSRTPPISDTFSPGYAGRCEGSDGGENVDPAPGGGNGRCHGNGRQRARAAGAESAAEASSADALLRAPLVLDPAPPLAGWRVQRSDLQRFGQ